MKTMSDNKYVPTWERKYDPWDREPEYWENEEVEETETDEISLELVDEKDLSVEFDESEFDLDLE